MSTEYNISWLRLFVIVVVVILLMVKVATIYYSRRKLAPGPIAWLGLGTILELRATKYPHLGMVRLAKKYGPVMGIGFGTNYSVVISGYEEMEMLFSKQETIESRFEFPYVEDRNFHKVLGIIWGRGDQWREMRGFTWNALQEFGFGKNGATSTDALLADGMCELEEHLRASIKNGSGIWSVDSDYLLRSGINFLWSFVSGYRLSNNYDEKLLEYIRLNNRVAHVMGPKNIYNAYPCLKRWFPWLVQHNVHLRVHEDMQNWIQELITDAEIQREKRALREPRSFVELFLDEIRRNEGKHTNFTREQLAIILLDIFFAGSETTMNSLNWAILYLTLNPEKQAKLKSELTITTPISVKQAAELPYLKAVILEVLRLGNPVPLGAPRMAVADIHFQNYLIPKGAAIFSNMTSVFMDERFWGDPESFRPERFLNNSGAINSRYEERMAVFGFGGRNCIGKSVAWNILLMHLMTLFTVFTFEVIPGHEPSAKDPIATTRIRPRPYTVRVVSNETEI